MLIPPSFIINDERPSIGSRKIEHLKEHLDASSSSRFTISSTQDYISNGPSQIELSKADMKRSLKALFCQ